MPDEYPGAVVRSINGQLVLDDPDALAMMEVVDNHNRAAMKANCRMVLRADVERMRHFVARIGERGDDPSQVMVTEIFVDDPHGKHLADMLMPGHDWAAVRATGASPAARGLTSRDLIQDALDLFAPEAAAKLRAIRGIAIVVIAFGTADVYTPADLA